MNTEKLIQRTEMRLEELRVRAAIDEIERKLMILRAQQDLARREVSEKLSK